MIAVHFHAFGAHVHHRLHRDYQARLDAEVAATNKLITSARKKNVPVIFTVVGYDPHRQDDAGLWPEKAPSLRLLTLGSELVDLDPRLDRSPEDLVIVKKYASGFFGTYLASTLTMRAVDTVIVTGCTTSRQWSRSG